MNLAFVHGPAAPTVRPSTAQIKRHTSLGPGSRPPSSNSGASIVEQFRGCADENMETQRLRAIQHPNRATALLESWASSQAIIPVEAQRIQGVNELSAPLRYLVSRLNREESVWCAWSDAFRIWLVAAAPCLDLARERNKPVLQIKVYNECGEMTAAAAYVHTFDHGWQRCE